MKKFLVIILVIVSVMALTLSACTKPQIDKSSFDYVKDCFTRNGTAVSSVQSVSVKAGESTVYSAVTTYTINGDNILAVTDTTTLNADINATEPTTTVQTSEKISAEVYADRVAAELTLTEDDVENLVVSIEAPAHISFDVKAAAAKTFLGLSDEEIGTIGTIHVTITIDQSHIKVYNITYTTTNGNTTVINTEYTYA